MVDAVRALTWAGPAVGVLFLAVVAYLLWSVYGAWPVPDGYTFPRHSIWGGAGPAALFDGELVDEAGCIRTTGPDGATVVWPPGYWLQLRDGSPEVHGGVEVVAMGEPVRMGGGWYAAVPPTGRDIGTCPPPYFLTTGVVEPTP